MKSYRDYLAASAVPREALEVFLDPERPSACRFHPVTGYEIDSFLAHDGVGGFGAYQAYRRMVEKESDGSGAEYVVFFAWGDDHIRSAMRCRHAVTYPVWDHAEGRLFHNNFWASLEMDLERGILVERENMLSTPRSLFQMCDPEFMVASLEDDLMVQLSAAPMIDPKTLDYDAINALAALLGASAVSPTAETDVLLAALERVKESYGFAATAWVLDRTHNSGVPFVDVNVAHVRDYRDFSISHDEYLARYHVGHYDPLGNLFFAFSIKDALLKCLDPPPITYKESGAASLDYGGYLGKYSARR